MRCGKFIPAEFLGFMGMATFVPAAFSTRPLMAHAAGGAAPTAPQRIVGGSPAVMEIIEA